MNKEDDWIEAMAREFDLFELNGPYATFDPATNSIIIDTSAIDSLRNEPPADKTLSHGPTGGWSNLSTQYVDQIMNIAHEYWRERAKNLFKMADGCCGFRTLDESAIDALAVEIQTDILGLPDLSADLRKSDVNWSELAFEWMREFAEDDPLFREHCPN